MTESEGVCQLPYQPETVLRLRRKEDEDGIVPVFPVPVIFPFTASLLCFRLAITYKIYFTVYCVTQKKATKSAVLLVVCAQIPI